MCQTVDQHAAFEVEADETRDELSETTNRGGFGLLRLPSLQLARDQLIQDDELNGTGGTLPSPCPTHALGEPLLSDLPDVVAEIVLYAGLIADRINLRRVAPSCRVVSLAD